MKKSNVCPKCNGQNIYTNAGLMSRGERCTVAVSSWTQLFVETYVCLDCGFFEEYVMQKELRNAEKIEKIKSTWKKVDFIDK